MGDPGARRGHVHRRGWVPVLLLTLVASLAVAEEERPRIGLALSGGGTKAGAHIGVLRELERLAVPIDRGSGYRQPLCGRYEPR